METGKKLELMRESEYLTKKALSKITQIPYSTLCDCEKGRTEINLSTAKKLLNNERLKKYTMWFIIGDTAPEVGQIEPALYQLYLKEQSNMSSYSPDLSE